MPLEPAVPLKHKHLDMSLISVRPLLIRAVPAMALGVVQLPF